MPMRWLAFLALFLLAGCSFLLQEKPQPQETGAGEIQTLTFPSDIKTKTQFGITITVELPSDTPYKNVSGNTLTNADWAAQIYPDHSLHYYILKIKDGVNINIQITENNFVERILSRGNLTMPKLYPILNETKEERLMDNNTDENGATRLTYRNYTTYTGGAATDRLNTNIARHYIVEFQTDAWASGHFNLTAVALRFDPDISACGFLNGANTVFTLNQSVAINGSTCFTFNATNQTLDCAGFSVTGNNTTSTAGAKAGTQQRTTITGCTIQGFDYAVLATTAANLTIRNNTLSGTGANFGIIRHNGNPTLLIDNNTVDARSANANARGIRIQAGTAGGTINNTVVLCNQSRGISIETGGVTMNHLTVNATGACAGIVILISSPNNLINDSNISGYTGIAVTVAGSGTTISNNIIRQERSGNAISATPSPGYTVNGIRIENNTICGNGSQAVVTIGNTTGSTANTFINNTLSLCNAGSAAYLSVLANANNISAYWNNFTTGTTGSYVLDINGTNSYNSTRILSQTRAAGLGESTDTCSAGAEWTDPTNIYTNDNAYARSSIDPVGDTTTACLLASGFNFSIPSSASISGIVGNVHVGGSQATATDSQIMLHKDGVAAGDAKSIYTISTTETDQRYPSGTNTTDLWGTTWTPEQVNNNTGFGLGFSATEELSANTISTDYMEVTVYYTMPTEGNIWANVNSSNLTGTAQSAGFPDYKVATGGTSYPYNNSTSGGKFICSFAGCGDYAPLFYSPAAAGDTCTYSSGNWNIACSDNCNLSANSNLNLNNITITGTGTLNISANLTNFTRFDTVQTCKVIIYQSAGSIKRGG